MMAVAEEGLWDASDVARYLKMSKSWVYQRVMDGKIPFHRLPTGVTRYVPEEIRAYARGEWKPPKGPTLVR